MYCVLRILNFMFHVNCASFIISSIYLIYCCNFCVTHFRCDTIKFFRWKNYLYTSYRWVFFLYIYLSNATKPIPNYDDGLDIEMSIKCLWIDIRQSIPKEWLLKMLNCLGCCHFDFFWFFFILRKKEIIVNFEEFQKSL